MGNYEGGALFVFQQDDGTAPLGDVLEGPKSFIDTTEFARFDGNQAHGVTPFQGDRSSIIFFSTLTSEGGEAQMNLQWLQEWQQ